jgi:cellulose synthase/poly-beta-1,6-N-acetylglucosamine synthase-like glycosyltransferase
VSAIFLCSGLLLLALAQHPFISYPLSLLLAARLFPRPLTPAADANRPESVALCMCAYNEERVIGDKVENMLAMRKAIPNLEILIYVDAATDRTVDILRSYGDAIVVIEGKTRQGKTHGMNTLVASTSCDLIVFTDANTVFIEDTLPNLLRPFDDPSVGCVCGHLVYTSAVGGATAETGALYWRLEEWIKERESQTGSVMGADGSIFAIRRCLHRPPPPDFFDDLFVSLSILCAGYRVVRAADALAYEETTSVSKEEFTRKIRIGCMAFNVHRFLRADLRRLDLLDKYKYLSHRRLRWVSIYLLAGGVLCLAISLAIRGYWLVLSLGILFAAALAFSAWRWPHGLLGRGREIFIALLATGIGVWRSIRGVRYQTWTPVSSARRSA